MTLKKIISGGQSGVDLGALRAAKAAGLQTGGFMPMGFRTEYGKMPHYATEYGMVEHPSHSYAERTRANVDAADLTIWIGPTGSPGYVCTRGAVNAKGQAMPTVQLDITTEAFAAQLRVWSPTMINFAGSRESRCPGIGAATYEKVLDTLRLLMRQSTL